jgi:bifunctional non-homologous end joining protein LigD
VRWVAPGLVAEVRYIGWSGAGRLRHAAYLGLREDKPARQVVRPVADAKSIRTTWRSFDPPGPGIVRAAASAVTVASRRGAKRTDDAVRLTHPERELWPGKTKLDLAEYWAAVAGVALPGIAGRPLALVRCPEGIGREHFFQKHATPGMPPQIAQGQVDGAPYLSLADAVGLRACAQISAIELHAWGARLADPHRPDQMVFDLDPGEGVAFAEVVRAALELRQRLQQMRLTSLCRTTGGNGLHVVVPLRPAADWDQVRGFSQALARLLEQEQPRRYVASVPRQRRRGRILIDWLRNGLGATSVVSFSPRARPGATVATPLHWREVNEALDPAGFTIATVPARLRRQRADPWAAFAASRQLLPALA